MRYAIVFNQKVTNTIIVNPEDLFTLNVTADEIVCIEDHPEVGVEWSYINSEFIPPAIPEVDE